MMLRLFHTFQIFFLVILKSCCGLGVILVNTRVKIMKVEKPRDEFSSSFNLSSKILRHTERISKCDVYVSVCEASDHLK